MKCKNKSIFSRLIYKLRKRLGLTIMEDIINETTQEEIDAFRKEGPSDSDADWVSNSVPIGM